MKSLKVKLSTEDIFILILQVLLYIQGEEVKSRKKQRKVETEVAGLRLKLATIQSKNIVLSNREIRLLR